MDGIYIVLLLITGLIDMWVNYCDAGCVKPVAAVARHMISAGGVYYEGDYVGHELYYRYDFPVSYGPFQPAIGASFDTRGDYWIGAGVVNTLPVWEGRAYAQFTFMPGLWWQGDGPVLGHPVEFRGALDAGIEMADGMRYAVSADHRSNAGLGYPNPNFGIEAFQMKVSAPAEVFPTDILPTVWPK